MSILSFGSWWGVSCVLAVSGLLLLGSPINNSGGPYSWRQAWGFILVGVALGWFVRGI